MNRMSMFCLCGCGRLVKPGWKYASIICANPGREHEFFKPRHLKRLIQARCGQRRKKLPEAMSVSSVITLP